MPGILDFIKNPQNIGLLLAGIGSAGTGDQSYIDDVIGMRKSFQDMEIKREILAERKRQQEATKKLPSLMSAMMSGVESQDLGVGANTPAGSVMVDLPMTAQRRAGLQGEALGLLGEIAPDTMAKGLLESLFKPDQGREDPADLRIMDANGYPRTREGFAAYNRDKAAGGEGGGFKDLLERAQLNKLLGDAEADRTARGNAAADKDQKFKLDQRAANRNMDDLFELSDLNDKLKGTSLQPGLPLPDWRRAVMGFKVAGLESLGDKEQGALREQIGTYDRLRKGLNNLIINNKDRFGTSFTNQMQTLLENASANPNIMPEAIDHILGQMASQIVDTSDILGFELKSRDQGLEFVDRMKVSKPRPGGPVVDLSGTVDELGRDFQAAKETVGGAVNRARAAAPGAVAAGKEAVGDAVAAAKPFLSRAADIARLTRDKIDAISADDIKQMTDDQKRALLKRINELKAGR